MKKSGEVEYGLSGKVTAQDIANLIDHANLKPQATLRDTVDCCTMAKKYNCFSCCVRPSDIETAKKALEGTEVIVSTVIGFPHGVCSTEVKVFETQDALAKGAEELDMVLNIGRLKGGDYAYVEKDIKAVVEVAHEAGIKCKVILENAFLNEQEKLAACHICERVGADFTKTSTGFASGGATISDLKLMRANTGREMQVKAAGGIRTLDALLEAVAAGASRIGTSSTEAIMEEAIKREKEGSLLIPTNI